MFPPRQRGWSGEAGELGLGRSCGSRRNGPVCIYSCLTQHNLIFHIKDQIIFQLQLITHPKSTSKDSPRPPSPCFAAPRAPRFHAWLRGGCSTEALQFTPTWAFEAGGWGSPRCLLGPQAPCWAPRTVQCPTDTPPPHQNSSPGASAFIRPSLPQKRNTPSDTSTPPAGWGREQSGHIIPIC